MQLKDKFLLVFDWLQGIKSEECSHFYSNPFFSNTENNTDFTNFDTEPLNLLKSISKTENKDQIKVQKIDPFENPKIEHDTNNRLPKRRHRSSKDAFFEYKDKRTLAISKDFTTYLHLKNNEEHDLNARHLQLQYASEINKDMKETLRKNILLNDAIFTRMNLDLYVL